MTELTIYKFFALERLHISKTIYYLDNIEFQENQVSFLKKNIIEIHKILFMLNFTFIFNQKYLKKPLNVFIISFSAII